MASTATHSDRDPTTGNRIMEAGLAGEFPYDTPLGCGVRAGVTER
jgi:hypothetical protein